MVVLDLRSCVVLVTLAFTFKTIYTSLEHRAVVRDHAAQATTLRR